MQRNVLAAALIAALPVAMASTAASAADAPRSNWSMTTGSVSGSIVRGAFNRPNAGRAAPTVAGTHAVRPAATLPVANCLDDGSGGTLREVLAAAIDGDTVDLTALVCSVITLQGGGIDIIDKSLTIRGPGRDALTIDGNGADRIFNAFATQPPWVTDLDLEGLSIVNGNSPYGGCLYVGTDLTLDDVTISGCTSTGARNYGGGVDVIGDLTLTASTISSNTVEGSEGAVGGGAYVYGALTMSAGSVIADNRAISDAPADARPAVGGGALVFAGLSIVDSVVSGNLAHARARPAYGGGLALMSPPWFYAVGEAVILRSTISGNEARSDASWSYGGGVQAGSFNHAGHWMSSAGNVTIDTSTVSGNRVHSACDSCVLTGGGIGAAGKINVTASTVAHNRVDGRAGDSVVVYGGGLATRMAGVDGRITITQSTLSGNAALGHAGSRDGHGQGGGAAALLSGVDVSNSTVTQNYASRTGGGLFLGPTGNSSLKSSIVARNEAPEARDIAAFTPTTNVPTTFVTGDSNIVIAAGINIEMPADTLVIEPRLAPLADNGGPTWTHAPQADSPAIDAGSNAEAWTWDQRGTPFARESGLQTDIGAFECQGNPVAPRAAGETIFRDGFDGPTCEG